MPRNPLPCQWRSDQLSRNHIGDYKPFTFVDGEGVRCSLYVSGCPFACEGCFNRAAQSFRYGYAYTKDLEDQIITDLSQPYVQGLTLLGGEPFLNTDVCIRLATRVRSEFGGERDIWSWSGYTFEEILADTPDKQHLLSLVDILIDGRFLLSHADPTLQFRGSSNQRIINVKTSLNSAHVVLWDKLNDHKKASSDEMTHKSTFIQNRLSITSNTPKFTK